MLIAPEVAGSETLPAGAGEVWRKCLEAEAKCKRLEAELRAEKEARKTDRVTRSRSREDVQDHRPAIPRSTSVEKIDASLQKVHDAVRRAIVDSGELRRHSAEQRLNSASVEEIVERLQESLTNILDQLPSHQRAAAEYERTSAAITEQTCVENATIKDCIGTKGIAKATQTTAQIIFMGDGEANLESIKDPMTLPGVAEDYRNQLLEVARSLALRIETVENAKLNEDPGTHAADGIAHAPERTPMKINEDDEALAEEIVADKSTNHDPLLAVGLLEPLSMSSCSRASPKMSTTPSPIEAMGEKLSSSSCSRASPKMSTTPSPIEATVGEAGSMRGFATSPAFLRSRYNRSVRSAPTRSSSSSSPLAPSPLSLLSEEASISPLDVRSPHRAHSLSYSGEDWGSSRFRTRSFLQSGEATTDHRNVVVGPSWSDDPHLLHRFQTQAAVPRSRPGAPPFGRGAPRGGRQPHRVRLHLEVDGMNRLPEQVYHRLKKARAHSVGIG